MKMKESREFIATHLTKVRHAGDLEMVKNLMDLIISVNQKECSTASIERFLLIRAVLLGDLTDKDVKMLNNLRRGMELAHEKANRREAAA